MSDSVVVALSGGVDSSIAAFLVKITGRPVSALFMQNWEPAPQEAEFCRVPQDFQDAQQVCHRLGIPLHGMNFAAEYWEHVFQDFLRELQQGSTPNPDILCNQHIKFGIALQAVHQLLQGQRWVTGHYARVGDYQGRKTLLKARDSQKDQTYFLYALSSEQLNQVDFPLGEMTKSEVRDWAERLGLVTAKKKDSMGICFIGQKKFAPFIQTYLEDAPGPIQTLEGQVLGQHSGLHQFTLGQRKGLRIGGRTGASSQPWWVVGKSLATRTLWVSQDPQSPYLMRRRFRVHHFKGAWRPHELLHRALTVKTRHQASEMACQLRLLSELGVFEVEAEAPIRAVTPGQAAVFYEGQACLGGGTILPWEGPDLIEA